MTISRRHVLALGTLALAAGCAAAPAAPTDPAAPAVVGNPPPPPDATARLAAIEAGFGGRLGVFALDTATGASVGHRADERFLLCSTSKMPTAAAVLRAGIPLDEAVRYSPADLVRNSPTTARATSMSIGDLCVAALTVSDNTAENLLLRRLGGPKAVEAFVRSIDDRVSSFDRTEPALNDRRGTLDTSTPRQMATTLRACTIGGALAPREARQLTDWLVANTTGGGRIRAGLPPTWRTGDKTGSGDRNEVNDVAITWPPGRPPILISVYTEPADPESTRNVPAVPAAASAAVATLVGNS